MTWRLAIYNLESRGWYNTAGKVPYPAWTADINHDYTFSNWVDLDENIGTVLPYSLNGFEKIAIIWVISPF